MPMSDPVATILDGLLPPSDDEAAEFLLDYIAWHNGGSGSLGHNAAFERLDQFFPHAESHLDRLRAVHHAATPAQRQRLRAAHAGACSLADVDRFATEVMRDLIDLVGQLRNERAFRALVPIIGQGPWDHRRPELVGDVVAVANSIARSESTYTSLKDLSGYRNFRPELALAAFEVMIQSRVDAWAEDFVYLTASLAAVRVVAYQSPEGSAEYIAGLRELALTMSEEVPLPRLATGLHRLDRAQQVSWDLLRLLTRDRSPLKLVRRRDRVWLSPRIGSVCHAVDGDDEFFDLLECYGFILAQEADAEKLPEFGLAGAAEPGPTLQAGLLAMQQRLAHLRPAVV
jgi:hypothetical protein